MVAHLGCLAKFCSTNRFNGSPESFRFHPSFIYIHVLWSKQNFSSAFPAALSVGFDWFVGQFAAACCSLEFCEKLCSLSLLPNPLESLFCHIHAWFMLEHNIKFPVKQLGARIPWKSLEGIVALWPGNQFKVWAGINQRLNGLLGIYSNIVFELGPLGQSIKCQYFW